MQGLQKWNEARRNGLPASHGLPYDESIESDFEVWEIKRKLNREGYVKMEVKTKWTMKDKLLYKVKLESSNDKLLRYMYFTSNRPTYM